ncbi:MAG: hypothetical protein QF927_09255, partial [Verrucomicrobiota bacterium]|nr:hypothetical protein [Verrucomicrobiota bacterium]
MDDDALRSRGIILIFHAYSITWWMGFVKYKLGNILGNCKILTGEFRVEGTPVPPIFAPTS